jgi:hypothetical protein
MELAITGRGSGVAGSVIDSQIGMGGEKGPYEPGSTNALHFTEWGGSKDESHSFNPSEWKTTYERNQGKAPTRKTYERYGSDELASYYDYSNLERQNQEVYARVAGRTVVDDVSMYEDQYEVEEDPLSPASFLMQELDAPQVFSIKGFNKRLLGQMHQLYTRSKQVPINIQQSVQDTVRGLGAGLESLRQIQNQREELDHELNTLRDQYWLSGGSREVRTKIQKAEQQLQQLEIRFKAAARPLINQLDQENRNVDPYTRRQEDQERSGDTEQIGGGVGDTGGGEGGDGRGGNGRGNDGPERARGRGDRGGRGGAEGGGDGNGEGHRGLRGRGEGDTEEESLYGGKAVKSIEDLGEFMEIVTEGFLGRIMASLYRGAEPGSVISDDELPPEMTEEQKAEIRLYAFKVDKKEYARNYNRDDVPEQFRVGDGNKILMLTAEEIRTYYGDSPGKPGERAPGGRGQERKDYWEPVKIVRPDEFMNWIRNYWTIVHGDDPDNPSMNFFTEIVVDSPEQRGAVRAGQMHKNAGAFLRSRFLTDPTTGDLRVYEALKDEIINEVWVTSGERNKEIFFKKVMHADEELPKQMSGTITADNLMAKNAAGGKNTLEMFFTLPEHFLPGFDWRTGEVIPENDREVDIGFGSGMLLAYEIYYNISDFEGLERLLGENASMFNRDFITRAVLEKIPGMGMPENLNDPVIDENGNTRADSYYEAARDYLMVIDEGNKGTIVDIDLYDVNGRVKRPDTKEGADALRRWLIHLNPYYPAQKDLAMLDVLRKVVENQMQEIVGIEKSAAASGLAEFHAYYRTYHDGIASRHDVGMGNRNSQSKYEFLGAPGGYQDKQLNRDRSGNMYTKGLVWGPTVGVLHAMPTRDGETVQDVLAGAVNKQVLAGKEYRDLLRRMKEGEVAGIDVNQIKARFLVTNPINIDGDKETNDILAKIRKIDGEISKAEGQPSKIMQKRQQRYHLVQQALEARLRNIQVSPELATKWNEFQAAKKNAYAESSKTLARLRFDEVQYAQYGGMHYNNSTGIFHMEMESNDLPMDKISGHDYEGRTYFKTTEFGPWLEESEKRMRYTIETWPLPLGAKMRKLVNPRQQDKEVPKFVDMTMIESVFGPYDYTGARNGGVMGMAQKMINRELAEKNEQRHKKGESLIDIAALQFTDGKGNVVKVRPDKDEKTGKYNRDKLGNIVMIPEWDDPASEVNRENLRKLVGYVKYDKDNNLQGFQKGILDDPAKYFTRAYVKMRIADFLYSHTDKATPYERWTVHQREEFFHALELSNYFTHHDIEDIREFSDNGYWKNFGREAGRALRKEGAKGFLDSLKFFFVSGFKS